MYEGFYLFDHLHPDYIAGPILGFLISLYAVTSGSAYFAVKSSLVRGLTSRILFCSINIFFGLTMSATMVSVFVFDQFSDLFYFPVLFGDYQ